MPRKDPSLAEKIDLLNRVKKQAPNTSQRTLEKITGVPKSTISRVLQNEERLRGEWASQKYARGTSRKRKREGKEPEVEDALHRWFNEVSDADGVHITGPILKAKAEDIAKKLGRDEFRATDGWLSRWKSRANIRLGKGGAEVWKYSELHRLLQKFPADDIYNARETGLHYRATPDGSLCYDREALKGSKNAMDRITVLCCSNMSGSDRKKLLVVGGNPEPRCFGGLRMDGLPVLYRSNKNARMTDEIFSKWLSEWDAELQLESRKILLLLENCAAHVHLKGLKNIQLEFLPPNAILQPMDAGIVKNLKASYRGKLVTFILEAIEDNLLQETSTAGDVCKKINILRAIQFLADSWREMSQSAIRNSFSRCGWNCSEQSEDLIGSGCVDKVSPEVQRVKNYLEYISVDDNIECYNKSDFDEAFSEDVSVKREETTENTGGSDADEEIDRVSHRDAKKFIAGLRLYFMQSGNEGSPAAALDACADFVHRKQSKPKSTAFVIKKNNQ